MNTITQNNTETLHIADRGIQSNFQVQLAEFFDFATAASHMETITDLCLAFTGATANIKRSRKEIAGMVFSTDKIVDLLRDAQCALTQDDSCLDDCNVQALDTLLGVDGAALIEILKWSLQCWIYFDDQELSINEVQDAASKFQMISKLIETCNEMHLKNIGQSLN